MSTAPALHPHPVEEPVDRPASGRDLVVVRQICYVVSRAGILSSQHIEGQLSECIASGERFYVREALDPHMSFYTSSGERWGMKHEGVSKRLQILEVACRPEAFRALKSLVESVDPLHRRVEHNRRFTVDWALTQFSRR